MYFMLYILLQFIFGSRLSETVFAHIRNIAVALRYFLRQHKQIVDILEQEKDENDRLDSTQSYRFAFDNKTIILVLIRGNIPL